MSNMPIFASYAAAFEETLIDDDWSRLEQYFDVKAVYLPGDGTEGIGRAAAIQALKNSVERLEKRCDSRELLGEPEIKENDDVITLKYQLKYTKNGYPDFDLIGTETVKYADGLILRMEDIFEDSAALLDWQDQIKS